jgi:hypothetical protein
MSGWRRFARLTAQAVAYAAGLTGLSYLAGLLSPDDAAIAILLAFVLCAGWSFAFGVVIRRFEALWAPAVTAVVSLSATALAIETGSPEVGMTGLYLSVAIQAIALGLLGAVVATGVAINGRGERS